MPRKLPTESGEFVAYGAVPEPPSSRLQVCANANILLRAPDVKVEITKTLEELKTVSNRLAVFFQDLFPQRVQFKVADTDLIKAMYDQLLMRGILSQNCFVGHQLNDVESSRDELIISTSRGLVLFNCDENNVQELRYMDPKNGLIIQLFPDDTRVDAFFENCIEIDDELWNAHVDRWEMAEWPAIIPQAQAGSNALVTQLMEWDEDTTEVDNLKSSELYLAQIQQAAVTLTHGLNAINEFAMLHAKFVY